MVPRFERFTSNITIAYKYIIKIKAQEMRKFGLNAAHVMCLLFIGRNCDGHTAGELAELCNEDKSSISKALAVLRKKNFIAKDDKNGTQKYRAKYKITQKGAETYERIIDAINNVIKKCTQGLSDEERRIFYESLEKIVNNMINFHNELEQAQ